VILCAAQSCRRGRFLSIILLESIQEYPRFCEGIALSLVSRMTPRASKPRVLSGFGQQHSVDMKRLRRMFSVWIWAISLLGLSLVLVGQELASKPSARRAALLVENRAGEEQPVRAWC
jgi:hypothetical protein